MADSIALALCFDRHLALPAAVVIASVLRSARGAVQFHLLIDPAPDLARFMRGVLAHFGGEGHIIEATPEAGFGAGAQAPFYGVASSATYRRLYLPELLTDLDRVIYLDADVLVRADLAALWATALGDCPLGAVLDAWAADNATMRQRFPDGYFNSGVLLMDLARWRAQRIGPRIASRIGELAPGDDAASRLYDQGPLNEALCGEWRALPPRWNFTAYFTDAAGAALGLTAHDLADLRQNPAIMHFVGGYKPWLDDFAGLSRYHAEFNALRAELERDLDLAGFAWPGRFGGHADARRRRLRAMSLVGRAQATGRRRWVIVAKGTLAIDVIAVAREQGLDIVGVASENLLFGGGCFAGLEALWAPDAVRHGHDSFLIADFRTSAATAAALQRIGAAAGVAPCIVS